MSFFPWLFHRCSPPRDGFVLCNIYSTLIVSLFVLGMDYQGDNGGGFQNYGGGGGMGSPQQQGGSSQNQRSRRSYDEQTLIPVTIKMALGAVNDASSGDGNDGNLILQDGRKLTHIQLVAAVRSVADHSTNVLYELEDGTGLMEVKQWFDDNDCAYLQELKSQTVKDNIYVKVVGQIKMYDNKCMVIANSIRPLVSNKDGGDTMKRTGGNELTHHMLSVIYSAEKYKRSMDIVGASNNYVGGSSGIGFNGVQSPQGPALSNNRGGGMMGGGGHGGGGNDRDEQLKHDIIQYIQTNSCKSTAIFAISFLSFVISRLVMSRHHNHSISFGSHKKNLPLCLPRVYFVHFCSWRKWLRYPSYDTCTRK